MRFHFDNEQPIYLQLIEQIKFAIISGKLAPGEKLSSVRDLASQARANPNTVQKALVELETTKLITNERSNGRYVTTNQKLIDHYRTHLALQSTHDYLQQMRRLGFDKKDIINYIKKGNRHA